MGNSALLIGPSAPLLLVSVPVSPNLVLGHCSRHIEVCPAHIESQITNPGLSGIDWAGFMIFDLGNPILEAIPVNWRVLNGLLQATSVRCAGVASVGIALLAPATQ